MAPMKEWGCQAGREKGVGSDLECKGRKQLPALQQEERTLYSLGKETRIDER